MKIFAVGLILIASFASGRAASTIDALNRFAYGANIGWVDWTGGSGETATGAVIGEYVCSGYIYAANVGWINLGSGSPANQIYYQNNSATDFGVNQDGLGKPGSKASRKYRAKRRRMRLSWRLKRHNARYSCALSFLRSHVMFGAVNEKGLAPNTRS